jgi:bacillithiol biosynthesis deacetylase BshB1
MNLLCIVAHPDDAGIFCGGTLAKHSDRGDDIAVIHMTRGEYGGIDENEQELARRRVEEARAATETLGVDTAFLDFEDGRVTYSLEARLALVDVIRGHEPHAIVTHYSDDMHPDHRVTSELVSDAYYMASLPLVETENPPHDPENVYYFGKPTSTFEPNTYVDITGYTDRKERAIECHESQVEFLQQHGGIDAEFDDLLRNVRAETRVYGNEAGVDHAERFLSLHETSTAYLR